MDPHEKSAVSMNAQASLCPGPRDLLQDMLFIYARRGHATFTRQADTMVRKGRSLRSVWRFLRTLIDGGWIESTPGAVRWHDDKPIQSPNSYRILTVAERHEKQREQEAEIELLVCQIGTLDLPEDNKPSCSDTAGEASTASPAETSTAREAARAFWLPTLPTLEAKEDAHEQERRSFCGAAGQSAGHDPGSRPRCVCQWHRGTPARPGLPREPAQTTLGVSRAPVLDDGLERTRAAAPGLRMFPRF